WNPDKIYSENRDLFLYPPQAAWFFTPFVFSPSSDVTKYVWFVINLGIIFTFVKISWIRFLAFFLLVRYLVINLYYGQVNLVVLFLALLTQSFNQHKAYWVSSLSLAINSTLKIFPILQSLDWILK